MNVPRGDISWSVDSVDSVLTRVSRICVFNSTLPALNSVLCYAKTKTMSACFCKEKLQGLTQLCRGGCYVLGEYNRSWLIQILLRTWECVYDFIFRCTVYLEIIMSSLDKGLGMCEYLQYMYTFLHSTCILGKVRKSSTTEDVPLIISELQNLSFSHTCTKNLTSVLFTHELTHFWYHQKNLPNTCISFLNLLVFT